MLSSRSFGSSVLTSTPATLYGRTLAIQSQSFAASSSQVPTRGPASSQHFRAAFSACAGPARRISSHNYTHCAIRKMQFSSSTPSIYQTGVQERPDPFHAGVQLSEVHAHMEHDKDCDLCLSPVPSGHASGQGQRGTHHVSC